MRSKGDHPVVFGGIEGNDMRPESIEPVAEGGFEGVGEIGLTGVASALASATYHATGVRVRDLPIRIENLLV